MGYKKMWIFIREEHEKVIVIRKTSLLMTIEQDQ